MHHGEAKPVLIDLQWPQRRYARNAGWGSQRLLVVQRLLARAQPGDAQQGGDGRFILRATARPPAAADEHAEGREARAIPVLAPATDPLADRLARRGVGTVGVIDVRRAWHEHERLSRGPGAYSALAALLARSTHTAENRASAQSHPVAASRVAGSPPETPLGPKPGTRPPTASGPTIFAASDAQPEVAGSPVAGGRLTAGSAALAPRPVGDRGADDRSAVGPASTGAEMRAGDDRATVTLRGAPGSASSHPVAAALPGRNASLASAGAGSGDEPASEAGRALGGWPRSPANQAAGSSEAVAWLTSPGPPAVAPARSAASPVDLGPSEGASGSPGAACTAASARRADEESPGSFAMRPAGGDRRPSTPAHEAGRASDAGRGDLPGSSLATGRFPSATNPSPVATDRSQPASGESLPGPVSVRVRRPTLAEANLAAQAGVNVARPSGPQSPELAQGGQRRDDQAGGRSPREAQIHAARLAEVSPLSRVARRVADAPLPPAAENAVGTRIARGDGAPPRAIHPASASAAARPAPAADRLPPERFAEATGGAPAAIPGGPETRPPADATPARPADRQVLASLPPARLVARATPMAGQEKTSPAGSLPGWPGSSDSLADRAPSPGRPGLSTGAASPAVRADKGIVRAAGNDGGLVWRKPGAVAGALAGDATVAPRMADARPGAFPASAAEAGVSPTPAALPEAAAGSPGVAAIDWEQLVGELSRRIRRQLTIERERRGLRGWL